MAHTFVNVTEGAGKKLAGDDYTDGANTVIDERVVLGEQKALATYTVIATGQSTATANSHLIQIMAGASLKVRIRRIQLYQVAVATAAVLMDLRILRLTTAGTGGTALTPAPLDTSDSASGATAMIQPTVKGTEGVTLWNGAAYMMQTIAASSPATEPIVDLDFDRPRSKPLIIAAGATNGICLKNITAVAAGQYAVVVWFDESNF